eukprot:CAMPEP_0206306458 /NCGR_PEP_ID=MMETSP0106_2-20121207/10809_1 /ASSEMBLY_ACC=CAM_ASM_000206 /TAXON_ID=81532 /ORGANISM="Acanthoeca-like sp., Strain 10tr" /LENGTH=445 /DNA_ID=CAMNT_0053737377 /DNA_START=463 /DNA_END=1800 /DNA_ORIENTATION=-
MTRTFVTVLLFTAATLPHVNGLGEDECPGGPNNVFLTEIPATLEACQAADACLPGGLSFSTVDCRAAPCNTYCESDGLCPGTSGSGDDSGGSGTCDGLDVYFKACGAPISVADLPGPSSGCTLSPPPTPSQSPTQSPTTRPPTSPSQSPTQSPTSRSRGEDECPGGPNNVFFTEIPATLEACQAADDCLPGGLSFSSVECRAAPCNSYCEGDGLCPGIGDEARFTGTCDPPGDFDGQGLDVYFKACGTAVAVSDLPEPPLCSATPAPPQSPTTAPTQSPTDIHAVCQPFAAALEPGDLICGAVCAGPTCSCGVLFDSIPTDGSCTTMCAEFGMVCVARHNDGPRIADMVCRDFVNNVAAPDACDDTFDDDDICVCSPTTSVPARHLMRRSVVMHGGSSNKGPLEAGETSQATVAVLVVAGVLMTLATLARASVGANPNVEVVLRA